ncbi:acetyl-CoA carboxylase carboxyl transferase subunit alpha [Lacrimispora sp. AGF001]|uniref:acetyl-CoA carboxylase carboxyl transferase subunit alpha n=1 Tax=Lacrimispora sp. AGF001 TaxID=3401631 RepID=UPI003B42E8F4
MSQLKDSDNSVWEKVIAVRSETRFGCMDLVNLLFDSFFELHGDRCYGDDRAVRGGLAYLDRRPVTVIMQCKGDSYKNRKECNFGMPLPEGYRKALRLMKQAEKYARPIITLVDTPGAYPGMEAEERGQSEAIARNLYEMSLLKVPVITVITGEGGSGGALALAVANRIIMLENAIFSVVSPEGCASILWKDKRYAFQAAKDLKITARDLYGLQIIDYIIEETEEMTQLADRIKTVILKVLTELEFKSGEEICNDRLMKYRNIGEIKNI